MKVKVGQIWRLKEFRDAFVRITSIGDEMVNYVYLKDNFRSQRWKDYFATSFDFVGAPNQIWHELCC